MFSVLIIFLFVGRARLRQLPVQPCGQSSESKHSKTGGRAPGSQYCYSHGDGGLHRFVSTGLTKGRKKEKAAIKVFLHIGSGMKGRREQRHLQLQHQSRANQT